MFETLKAQPADKILALVQAYREVPRDTKIDLGVGVYKDASGNTPIMRAVKAAEQRIWEAQETKVYTGLAGDPAFADAMVSLVLGDAAAEGPPSPRGNGARVVSPGICPVSTPVYVCASAPHSWCLLVVNESMTGLRRLPDF